MSKPLRVALFSDSFHERNGVGTVSREFAAFAQRRGIPFCSVRCGPATEVSQSGSVTGIELKRGIKIKADQDLYVDPLLNRYRNRVLRDLETFQPDLIHITGPSDVGILGFWISNLMSVPMVASWHTNLHEYVARRVHKNLPLFRDWASGAAERYCLRALMAFYRLAHFVMAPNAEMAAILRERTGRPSYQMQHGVDCTRFAPRTNAWASHNPFCIGWVGRLTPEKNVRAFAGLERDLVSAGIVDFRILIVGDGSESAWLRQHLRRAEFPGFLAGDNLLAAFASMNAFVFPSRTDTFGLVVLEAMALGIPVVVSEEAGARVGIHEGVEGLLCSPGRLCDQVVRLMQCEKLRTRLSQAGRDFARSHSWDTVFDDLYSTYEMGLYNPEVRRRIASRSAQDYLISPTSLLANGLVCPAYLLPTFL